MEFEVWLASLQEKAEGLKTWQVPWFGIEDSTAEKGGAL